MAAFFYRIYQHIRHRRGVFFLTVILVMLLLATVASRIRFEEDISRLLPAGKDSAYMQQILQSVKFSDKIIINVETDKAGHIAPLKAYADSLSALLSTDAQPYIKKLHVRTDDNQIAEMLQLVQEQLPLFLDEQDYIRLDSLTQPAALAARVREAYHALTTPSGLITTSFIRQDPLGISFTGLEKFRRLQTGDHFYLDDGYLIGKAQQNLLLFITPVYGTGETKQNKTFVTLLEAHIRHLNEAFRGQVSATSFGAVPMSVANAEQVKTDIRTTLAVALIVLAGLFIYFYRRIQIPFIILIPAVFGSLLGMAVLWLLRGEISAISIGIGSVLLGLTLDYSLHILSHYRSTGDIKKLFESTTRPLLICAVFTAVDFLCLLFLRSSVLQDLGIFAAVSVIGAAIFALIFMPHAYTPGQELKMRRLTFIDTLASYDFSKNRWVLLLSVSLAVISLFTFRNVHFNNDLATLNYQPDHLKQAEQKLDSLYQYAAKSIYLVAHGNTYEEAVATNNRLFRQLETKEKNQEILSFSSVGGILLSRDIRAEKIKRWQNFWTKEKQAQVRNDLIREGKKYGFRENSFQPFYNLLAQDFHQNATTDEHTLLQEVFPDEFISVNAGLTTITSIVKTEKNNTEALIQSLSGKDILVIDRKHMQETFLQNLEADFDRLFAISSIAVFLVLLLFFGSLELTLLTNIPIFLGWFVTLGLMGLLGIDFNAFNIIITTLIFGLGVDYAIFITKGLLESYTYGNTDMAAYKSGIIMSAITTMLCFGALVFARHPVIYSISLIPLTGLFTVVLMSFTIQPWLFRLFLIRPQQRGNTPRSLLHVLHTAGTFGYFFIGSFILSVLARMLMPLFPFGKEKKLAVFHRIVQVFFRTLIFQTPCIKSRIEGYTPDLFSKPVLLIANHTSVLDTPTMGMLHPKLIFMVNNRVRRSLFFGKAIRMAGFLSASDSYEVVAEQLQPKVAAGYSVIIFPEGTRSMTADTIRFHKGAFYLSEKLKMDIQPVMIHGNADRLPKHDNILKKGSITLRFLPVIPYIGQQAHEQYGQRAKEITQYFRKSLRAFRREKETATYFKDKLLLNYKYKPSFIRKTVKTVFQQRKNDYHRLVRTLPEKTAILHLGCGYGVLDFLLMYDSSHRLVTAWDPDPEKINAAQHTYSANRYPLHFVHQQPDYTEVFPVLIISGNIGDSWKQRLSDTEWLIFEQESDTPIALPEGEMFQLQYSENRITVYRKYAAGI